MSMACPGPAVSVPLEVSYPVKTRHLTEAPGARVEPWTAAVLPWPSASDPLPSTAVPWQLAAQSSSWREEFPVVVAGPIGVPCRPPFAGAPASSMVSSWPTGVTAPMPSNGQQAPAPQPLLGSPGSLLEAQRQLLTAPPPLAAAALPSRPVGALPTPLAGAPRGQPADAVMLPASPSQPLLRAPQPPTTVPRPLPAGAAASAPQPPRAPPRRSSASPRPSAVAPRPSAAARQPSEVELRARRAARGPLPARPDPQTGARRHQRAAAPSVPPGRPPTQAALADVVCVAHFLALFARPLRLCRRHIDAPLLEEALFDPGSHHPYIARLVRALLSHQPDLELNSSEPVVVFRALTQLLREHVPGEVFPVSAYQPDSRRPLKIEQLTPFAMAGIMKSLCDLAAEQNPAVRSAIDKDIESRTSKPSAAAAAAAAAATADAPVKQVDAGGVRMNRPLGWDAAGRSYYLIQTGDGSASGVRVFSEEASAPGRIGGGATTLQAFSVDTLDAAASTLDSHAVVQQRLAFVVAARPSGAGAGLAAGNPSGSAPPLATFPAARAAAALRVVRSTVAAEAAARSADDGTETEDEVEAADAAAAAAAKSRAPSPGTDDPAILRHRTRGGSKRKTRPGLAASAGRARRDGSASDSSSSSGSSSGNSLSGSDRSTERLTSGDTPDRGRQPRKTKRQRVRHVRSRSTSTSSGFASSGGAPDGQPGGPVTATPVVSARRRAQEEAVAKAAAAAARERRAADRAARLSRAAAPTPSPQADARPLRSGRETRALLIDGAFAPAASAEPPPPSPAPSRRTRQAGQRAHSSSLPTGPSVATRVLPGRRALRSSATTDTGGAASDGSGDASAGEPLPVVSLASGRRGTSTGCGSPSLLPPSPLPPPLSPPLASTAPRKRRPAPRAPGLAPTGTPGALRRPLPPPAPPPAGRLPWRWRLSRAPMRPPSPPPRPPPATGRLVCLAARPQQTDRVTASPPASDASSSSGEDEGDGGRAGTASLSASGSPASAMTVSDASASSASLARLPSKRRRRTWGGGGRGRTAAAHDRHAAAAPRRRRQRRRRRLRRRRWRRQRRQRRQ